METCNEGANGNDKCRSRGFQDDIANPTTGRGKSLGLLSFLRDDTTVLDELLLGLLVLLSCLAVFLLRRKRSRARAKKAKEPRGSDLMMRKSSGSLITSNTSVQSRTRTTSELSDTHRRVSSNNSPSNRSEPVRGSELGGGSGGSGGDDDEYNELIAFPTATFQGYESESSNEYEQLLYLNEANDVFNDDYDSNGMPQSPSSPTVFRDLSLRMPLNTFKYSEVRKLEIVGKGFTSLVHRGRWNGGIIALKEYKNKTFDPALAQEWQHEVAIHEMLNHPNVVNYLGCCEKPYCIALFFKINNSVEQLLGIKGVENKPTYSGTSTSSSDGSDSSASHTSASSGVKGKKRVRRSRAKPCILTEGRMEDGDRRFLGAIIHLLVGCSAGVLHMHQKRIVHRDIASRNFLVDNNYDACVCDFGFSRYLGDTSKGTTNRDHEEIVEEELHGYTQSAMGPVRWMAPEAIRYGSFSRASDVYMFGMFIWETLARSRPYPDKPLAEIQQRVPRDDLRPVLDSLWPKALNDIMRACWHNEPQDRTTMIAINTALIALNEFIQREEPIPTDYLSGKNEKDNDEQGQVQTPLEWGSDEWVRVVNTRQTDCGGAILSWASGYHRRPVNIKVAYPLDETRDLSVRLPANASVADIKYEIEKVTDVHPDQQRLMYAGKFLEPRDGKDTLADYNIGEGSIVQLFLRDGFPWTLGPFGIRKTQWDASQLQIKWGDNHPIAVIKPRRASSLAAKFRTVQHLATEFPLYATLSPISSVTLTQVERKAARIALDAASFAWCYPCLHSDTDVGERDPDLTFLLLGGYLYFDADKRLLHANAIFPLEPNEEGGLHFSGRRHWNNQLTRPLAQQGRFQNVTIKFLKDRGAHHFAWLKPNEAIVDSEGQKHVLSANGCFVYLFHKSPHHATQEELDQNCYFAVLGGEGEERLTPKKLAEPFRLAMRMADGDDVSANELDVMTLGRIIQQGNDAEWFNTPSGSPARRRSKQSADLKSEENKLSYHNITGWSRDQVFEWLKQVELSTYVGVFEEQGIKGDVLLELAKCPDQELKDIGIKSFHIPRLRKALATLEKIASASHNNPAQHQRQSLPARTRDMRRGSV